MSIRFWVVLGAALLVWVTVTSCGRGSGVGVGAKVSWQPLGLPVSFSIDDQGNFTVSRKSSIVTTVGEFSLDIGLTKHRKETKDGPHGLTVAVQHPRGGERVWDIYTVSDRDRPHVCVKDARVVDTDISHMGDRVLKISIVSGPGIATLLKGGTPCTGDTRPAPTPPPTSTPTPTPTPTAAPTRAADEPSSTPSSRATVPAPSTPAPTHTPSPRAQGPSPCFRHIEVASIEIPGGGVNAIGPYYGSPTCDYEAIEQTSDASSPVEARVCGETDDGGHPPCDGEWTRLVYSQWKTVLDPMEAGRRFRIEFRADVDEKIDFAVLSQR
ncbi:hypothetical protein [Streptomyces olivochromogenes]|uniref:hypothetical protein n=1 Tax=Streptomyces olivochromogenes TaxID=1963 RepID=UPI001F46840F|nr:hypothetical protein [Streptomyces olivochromogenes]MCF3137489.1 hypothetical protein [Streptomyces olivochromogenes]